MQIKRTIKRIGKRILVPVFSLESSIAKKVVSHAYKMLFKMEWMVDNPENFDHEIDLYYQWDKKCVPFWLERGVYSVQALKMFDCPVVLELCCGDGFNAKHFYSTSAKKILACDFDENIIKVARRKNSMKNITYSVFDIRKDIVSLVGCVGGYRTLFGMRQ